MMSKGLPIDDIVRVIREKYGNESVIRMCESGDVTIPTFSTGSIKLDAAVGIGGLPIGRIVEIYGANSSGKSTLCLHVIASAQKENKICAFIDTEQTLDPPYAKALGVDFDKVIFSQPTTGEEALSIAEDLIKTGKVSVIIVDSVANLVPKAELEGEMGDRHMGLLARLMAQGLRKLTGLCKKNGTLLIFTNQTREKLGIVYGTNITTPGGKALGFYASLRLNLTVTGKIKNTKDVIIGSNVKINVVKNKLAPPFRIAQTVIRYGVGFDSIQETIDFSIENKKLKKLGNTYSYKGNNIAVGKENLRKYLSESPELVQKLNDFILSGEKHGS